MCGISGELRFDGQTPDLAAVARMKDALARRGPDSEGDYHDGPLAFGHRRLAVIDLSERSHQPMIDRELGLALVFNGTIYNFHELRRELSGRGYQFFSDGDTEVIIKAYAAWGERCVEHMQGMFAFALWDSKNQKLFLARDRLGIKPLYYSRSENYLRFASAPQALLAAGNVDTSIDPVALHYQLTLHAVVPAPRTILNGVRKLAPATTMMVDANGKDNLRCYWQLDARRPAQAKTEAEWVDAIHNSLRSVVQSHSLISDVPVGVLLSGGLDSSLLVALLSEAGTSNLLTFSVGFEDTPEERGSEFEYSDPVAQRYGTQHHRFTVPNGDVLSRLPECVQVMAEPMVAQDAVAFYLLSEQVSQQVKVVQSGQGADEVFGGYFWYPLMQAESGSDLERFRKHYFDRSHAEFLETVTPAYHGGDYTSELIGSLLARPSADTFMDRVLRLDTTTLIVDDPVKRVDNMTMAWGLEARVPFLDHTLVELAAQMPPEIKLKAGGKYPLKAIARGLLPDTVIDRPKGYFPMPALKYVRGEFLNFMRDVLNSKACRQRGLFQRSYVEKLLGAPEQYMTKLNGSKLWHLALLEYWLQLNVDKN
ncbi:MAG: N-acetylglutaminylglutamine amidotransferase [Gammaproteobacteria bacterium]